MRDHHLLQRIVLLGVLVLALAVPASGAVAAPHCNARQDSSSCDPANLDPTPPSPPPPTPIIPVPIVQTPITITGPVQLISNGGFETGLVDPTWLVSTTASPWSLRNSVVAEVVSDNPNGSERSILWRRLVHGRRSDRRHQYYFGWPGELDPYRPDHFERCAICRPDVQLPAQGRDGEPWFGPGLG